MEEEDKLIQLVEKCIDSDELFLVQVDIFGNKIQKKVRVILDGDQGVSIEKCVKVSRKLSALLDENDIFDIPYTLEVSSPGIDMPLKLNRQYQKNIGRKVEVKLKDKSIKKGKMLETTTDYFVINEETKDEKNKILYKKTKIPFEEVEQTNVLVSF